MNEETLQKTGINQVTKERPLLDSEKKDYEEITFLTREISKCAVAVLYLYDDGETRVFSSSELSEEDIPYPGRLHNSISLEKNVLYVEDFGTALFREHPELGVFSFYAGVPLISSEKRSLGILYVLDRQLSRLTEAQEISMILLANQIIRLLDYREQHDELERVQAKLKQKYRDLEKFASVVSHDIKSPLANIISLTEFLKEENKGTFNEETRQYLDFLIQSSYSLRNYVDGILTFYRSDHILEKQKEDVDLHQMLRGIAYLFQVNPDVEIHFPASGVLQNVNKAALTQIFLNLIGNALKYNSGKNRKVTILFNEIAEYYIFQVQDNGNGIPKEDHEKIFDLFTTLDQNDRDGHPGSGIGLATVKKLIDHMQGSIQLESELGKGSNFKFRIKRK